MILFLIEYLRSLGFKVPIVFEYVSTRMALASVTTLLISIFLGPFFIKKLYEMKIGQPIRMEECPLLGQLHEKKKDTPTMGGILILVSMIFSLFIWMDLKNAFTLVLLVTTIWIGFLGGYDDYLKLKFKNSKGLSSKKKLLGQFLFSFLVALYLLNPSITQSIHFGKWFSEPTAKEMVTKKVVKLEEKEEKNVSKTISLTTKEYISRVYVPFLKDPVIILDGAFTILMYLFIMIVITGASNAVNLTDGLDGLATGCILMTAASFGLIAFVSNNIDIASYLNILYIEGSGEIAIYLFAMIGACLGFLWYNGHPAQVFMGDIGSLTMGAIIGVVAVLLDREILLAIIGGVFVAEAISVILQVGSYKLRNKKRIFLCSPLHHHFEYKGWHETKIVIRFWIVALLLAIVGVASLKFQ
jgi:phospho-N-acetylmuramoyl-pentapeptide-transferase